MSTITFDGFYTSLGSRCRTSQLHILAGLVRQRTSFKASIGGPQNWIVGEGSDNQGPFRIVGSLIGDDIRFTKTYTNSGQKWSYVGRNRSPGSNIYRFVGGWGSVGSGKQDGGFVLVGVVPLDGNSLPPSIPNFNSGSIVGFWTGEYYYNSNSAQRDPPMEFTLGVIYAPGVLEIAGNGADGTGPFQISGVMNPNGDFNATKYYDSFDWHYHGKFDGQSTITGSWGGNRNDNQGTFRFTKIDRLPLSIAKAVYPAQRQLFGPPRAEDREYIEATLNQAEKDGQIGQDVVSSLLNGFNQ